MDMLGNDLKFELYMRDKGDGLREPMMKALFPSFYTVELVNNNKESLKKLFYYTAFKFYLEQLVEGNKLLETIKEREYPFDTRLISVVEYNGKSALLNATIFNPSKLDIKPAMEIFGGGAYGFTVVPGNFSDFNIYEHLYEKNRLCGYTQDFMVYTATLTALFLERYMAVVEGFTKGALPKDYDDGYNYHDYFLDETYKSCIKEIHDHINEVTSRNKSKRIDSLVVDGKTVIDWMKKLDIHWRYMIPSENILDVSLAMGKPVAQVKRYMEKILDARKK